MESNHQRKKRFHQVKNYHVRDQMITNGTEIVTEIGTRGIPDLRKNLIRKSKDREVKRETEIGTGENVNVANHRNLTHPRIKIRIETEIVIEEMIESGKENEKEKGSEIVEENATELDIKV